MNFFKIFAIGLISVSFFSIEAYSANTVRSRGTDSRCLAALSQLPHIKVDSLSDKVLGSLERFNEGISQTDLAIFIVKFGDSIAKNCPKTVTVHFERKFDISFVILAKRLAGQECMISLRQEQQANPDKVIDPVTYCKSKTDLAKAAIDALNGGSAGLESANMASNAADARYQTQNVGSEEGNYSICCKSGSGTHNTGSSSAGGVCGEVESIENIFPCRPGSTQPILQHELDYGRFLQKHQPKRFGTWDAKYGSGSRTARKPGAGGPAGSAAGR